MDVQGGDWWPRVQPGDVGGVAVDGYHGPPRSPEALLFNYEWVNVNGGRAAHSQTEAGEEGGGKKGGVAAGVPCKIRLLGRKDLSQCIGRTGIRYIIGKDQALVMRDLATRFGLADITADANATAAATTVGALQLVHIGEWR
jgi:hypothetical protein